MVLPLDIHILY